MALVLQCLVIYTLVCMLITSVVLIRGFDELVDKTLPKVGYIDIVGFLAGILYVVLTSPFFIPVAVVRTIRKLWQEVLDQCRLLDEDHR